MEFIITDKMTGERAHWIEAFNCKFDTRQHAEDTLFAVISNPKQRDTFSITALGDDEMLFDIQGEDIDGEYIEFEFCGTIEQARVECFKTLEYCGGHLDIFDENGQFIEDYEF